MTSSRITRIALAAIVAWCLTLILVPAASAQTILRVDIDSTATNPDGSTWEDAFKYLQDALLEAENIFNEPEPPEFVQIWVAEGTYLPTQADVATLPSVGDDREHTFRLIRNVEIYGGFFGDEENLEEREPETYITILSGDLEEDDDFSAAMVNGILQLTFDNYDENSYHVVTAGHYTGYTGLSGCFDECDCADFGTCCPLICEGNFGAYCVCNPEPTFSVCDLCELRIDDTAVLDGFVVRSGRATDEVPVLGLQRFGGGILVVNAGPRIRNCVIERNRATDPGLAVSGGGVSVQFHGGPLVTNIARFDGCTIRHNEADSNGGGVHVGGSSAVALVDITSLREIQRAAFVDCTISDNKSGVFGGGVYAETHSIVDLVNSSIVGNVIGAPKPEGVSESDGAGVFAQSCAIRMWNCVVAQNINVAELNERAGGIGLRQPLDAEILNCTIADNRVLYDCGDCEQNSCQGAGIRVFDPSQGPPTIPFKNTVVWGNASKDGECDEERWQIDDV